MVHLPWGPGEQYVTVTAPGKYPADALQVLFNPEFPISTQSDGIIGLGHRLGKLWAVVPLAVNPRHRPS